MGFPLLPFPYDQSIAMSPRLTRALLGASLLLLPAACAEEDHGSVELVAATEFPVWMYQEVGPIGVQFPSFGIQALDFGIPFINAAQGAASASPSAFLASRIASYPGGDLAARVLSSPSCLPDKVGAGIDTDGDGIPNDATSTYTAANCTVYDSATGDAYLVRGVYRLRDTNDDRFGFRLDITNLSVRSYDGTDNSHQTVFYNAIETAQTTANAGSYRLILDAEGNSSDFTGPYARRIHYDLTEGYVPVGTVPVNGPLPDGTFTMNGNVEITSAGEHGAARVVLQLRTTLPLVYDDGCAGIVTGAHEMRLNGSTTEGIHVVYAGCSGHYEPLGAGTL